MQITPHQMVLDRLQILENQDADQTERAEQMKTLSEQMRLQAQDPSLPLVESIAFASAAVFAGKAA